MMYGSMNFVEWYEIGCTTLMAGDCPTFFPLPSLTPGSEHYVDAHGPMPTHVHKSGGKGGDQAQVGVWTEVSVLAVTLESVSFYVVTTET